ncbi:hypothetical protein QAD02_012235 [Eretmocerus hayati]|uniref:Uncharacterized protein n=1 Tax=Eretmocerus hayati TaxID=131215 RepID=A0ACC2NZ07_9HYME|nr:hypothetical protein QAD02_012235 [Eretmocerus hayati]
MALNNLLYWYQKKIGTYDKQQWERTVEQKIFCGFTHVPMRTAKLKTEFIDVDLVRGSSFPKAKPKHGLGTVAYLAIKRLIFLPFNAQWWIQQTSFCIYLFFLLLYGLQMLNVYIYFNYYAKDNDSENISVSEVMIPSVMMLILCVVHTQIVSTNSGPLLSSKYDSNRNRRSRHGRSRPNKIRSRRSTRHDEVRASQDLTSEKSSSIDAEISPSVRFAKRVLIESSTTTENSSEIKEPSLPKGINTENSADNPQSSVETQQLSVSERAVVIGALDGDEIDMHSRGIKNEIQKCNGNFTNHANHQALDPEKRNNHHNSMGTGRDETMQDDSLMKSGVLPCNLLAPGIVEIKSESNYSEEDECESPSSEHPSIQSSKDSRRKCESEEEGECEEALTSHLMDATTSATEWMGVTTNSDECSYSSELEESDHQNEVNHGEFVEHPFSWEFELPPSILTSSGCATSDRVSCTIWTSRDAKKAELSVLDISSAIIARVEAMPETMDYFYAGLLLSLILSLVPSLRRISHHYSVEPANNTTSTITLNELSLANFETITDIICRIINVAFGSSLLDRAIILSSAIERLILASLLFFLLAVAERTYKQRLLYAKLFSHLTSSRRARKSDLPHFRLNKVRNIKSWLSVRSYLKRRGPQRSVDVIVSSVFITTLALLSFVCLELIKDLDSLQSHYNIEALFWSFSLGIFILRFMTLGTKINKKYRNLSVLITEQINLYLQIEQKPHKKDELMVANSVLKLAADLIKELESPFKISGLSANPYLYTITKVVLLSALSGVLSELLGFKLKLHKIKIK